MTQPSRSPACSVFTMSASPPAASVARSRETYIAILALLGISVHLIARYLVGAPPLVSLTPLYITLVIGGIPLLIELARRLLVREFGADLLAGISVVVSVLLREYLVDSIVG